MMSKTRRTAHLVVALLLLAGAGEIGLRAFLGLGHPPLSRADPDYGYAFNPNQDLRRFGRRVFYNEHGLRSEPNAGPRGGGRSSALYKSGDVKLTERPVFGQSPSHSALPR